MSRFAGKSFVVTGGSGGIGRATAKRLVAEGAKVLVTGTNEEKLKQTAEEIPGVLTLKNDAGDPAAAETLAAAVKEHLGTIDGVFLNAGYGVFAAHNEVEPEVFDQQYAVNVRGPILQAKTLSALLNDGGSVLINASVAKSLGMPGGILYNSTKGAIRTVTQVLAAELAGRKIRVNSVSPGPIGSDFFDRTGMSEEEAQQTADWIMSQVPLGRFGEPDEIASVACFLLSDDASYMTGSDVVVDGGMTQT